MSLSHSRTNGRIELVLALVNDLIGWAEADVDASHEAGARAQQLDDHRRASNLKKARALLAASLRSE